MQAIPRNAKAILLLTGAALFALGATSTSRLSTVHAAQAVSPQSTNVLAGEAEAKRLLLLMDRDKNGKVSKDEFMGFMEAEFERLDVNHDGQLDVNELTNYKMGQSHGTHR